MQEQEIGVVWSRLPFDGFVSRCVHGAKAGVSPKAEMLLGWENISMSSAKSAFKGHQRGSAKGAHLSPHLTPCHSSPALHGKEHEVEFQQQKQGCLQEELPRSSHLKYIPAHKYLRDFSKHNSQLTRVAVLIECLFRNCTVPCL